MKDCSLYPVFESNQVLTAEQLNQSVTYLEGQERLTRNKLIGAGILCGFELKITGGANPVITILRGTGTTTEGYLISLEEDCILKKYRKYLKPDDAIPYAPFQGIEIFELLPGDTTGANVHTLNKAIMQQTAVVLFLECQKQDMEDCIGDDCDEKGCRLKFCVKKLLVNRQQLKTLIEANTRFVAGGTIATISQAIQDLPDLNMWSFNATMKSFASFNYYSFNDIHELYVDIIDPAVVSIQTALQSSYELYKLVYDANFQSEVFSQNFLYDIWQTYRGAKKNQIQYFYDFCKDLILAYNEYRDCVCKLAAECCVNEQNFPKHLPLGKADGENWFTNSIFRQGFIPAPASDCGEHSLKKVSALFRRMEIMIKNFGVPTGQASGMKVTPSKEKEGPLAGRAMPYYYFRFSQQSVKMLNRFWNFDLTKKNNNDQIFCYHSLYYSESQYVNTPLNFDIDRYPFFRFEGHLGYNIESVVTFYEGLNLPVRIISRKLSQKSSKDDLFNDYVQEHRGIDHFAGVEKGGTLILVYDDADKVVADFALPYICCSDYKSVPVEDLKIELEASVFCKYDKKKYYFTTTSEKAKVVGKGVGQDQQGFYFVPALLEDDFEGNLTFILSFRGQTKTLTVQVYNAPKATFTYSIKEEVLKVESEEAKNWKRMYAITLITTTSDDEKPHWDIKDQTHLNTTQDKVVILTPAGKTIHFTLTVSKFLPLHPTFVCKSSVSDSITTPEQVGTLKLPDDFTEYYKFPQKWNPKTPKGDPPLDPYTDRFPDFDMDVIIGGGIVEKIKLDEVDYHVKDITKSNIKSIEEIPLVEEVAPPQDPVMKNTKNYFMELEGGMKKPTVLKRYKQGRMNALMAKKFENLTDETFEKIKKISGEYKEEKRQAGYELMLTQYKQLLSMMNMQDKDIKENSPLYVTAKKINRNLEALRKEDKNIDKENKLDNLYDNTMKVVREKKPVYYNVIEKLRGFN